jgi:hypothetical protein
MRLGAFARKPLLAVLNVLAVGLTLAAATTTLLQLKTVASAFPTLVIGALWAALLRWPRKLFPDSKWRLGWVFSPILAVANACFTLFALEPKGNLVELVFMATVPGAILWVPALLATILFYGVPLLRAEQLAKNGLSGAERGERVIGLTTAVIGLLATWAASESSRYSAANKTALVMGVIGTLAGASAAVLAQIRHSSRGRFVREVEAGRVQGFRVDDTPQGKALVRVESNGEGYRVADHEEEIARLTAEGDVRSGRRRHIAG